MTKLLRPIVVTALFVVSISRVAAAQIAPPIRELQPGAVKSTEVFGNIFGVRQLPDGGVLINDGVQRRLIRLDRTLANSQVVLDSSSVGPHSYGVMAAPMISYVGDSTLFVDGASRSLMVIDPSGKVVRAMAAPKPADLLRLLYVKTFADTNGNLSYQIPARLVSEITTDENTGIKVNRSRQSDSSVIVRANFESRKIDSIGRLKEDNSTRTVITTTTDGKYRLRMTLNPIASIDDWAVLSDGTVAFVRGHDFSVDWLKVNGQWNSTGKLPYDWKKLSDNEKQTIVDSVRNTINRARSAAEKSDGKAAGDEAVLRLLRGAVASVNPPAAVQSVKATAVPTYADVQFDLAPLNEIPDYYPPVRAGAAKADLDNNLWILPTTSSQSRSGELVYDVINNSNRPFFRVRMPVGRSIAGFGRDGVVYLMSRDAAGWHLERAKLATNSQASK